MEEGVSRGFENTADLIAPGSIPRSLLRTFNFEIWKLKCLGACPEDLYWATWQWLSAEEEHVNGMEASPGKA